MAQIIYSTRALDDLQRAFDFLLESDRGSAIEAAAAIRHAVDALAQHPLIGRTTPGGLRELVISYGRTGYVALYQFVVEREEIRILAIRHQRELDYPA